MSVTERVRECGRAWPARWALVQPDKFKVPRIPSDRMSPCPCHASGTADTASKPSPWLDFQPWELFRRVDRADTGLQTELPAQGHGAGSPGEGGQRGGISLYLGCSNGLHRQGRQGPRICPTDAGRGVVPPFAARACVEREDLQKHLSVPPGSCDGGNILCVVPPESPWPLAVGGRGQVQLRTP